MKDLTTFLVKALVDHPDQVRVEERDAETRSPYAAENPNRYAGGVGVNPSRSPRSVVIEIAVAKEDMGKVIGKRGRTINAIRSLVKAAAIKENVHVEIDLAEE